ncbi:MAG: lipopolysaccharide transport periplasmic protein LptA [Burkholderiaceae bacterium]|nr:lipopolysaccharide transport periplasmic protein LptA [Burkholderiaceae bacterium]
MTITRSFASFRLALTALCLAAAATAHAASAPAEEPSTVVLSDSLDYDDVKKESVFVGNVIVTRGLMNLHADRVTVRQLPDGTQQGVAIANKGKLVRLRQERPETYETLEGTGLRAEYDDKKGEFVLIGQAVVTRSVCGKPFDTVRGQRVRYNQNNGTYQAEGGAGSAAPDGRVRSVAEPRAKADAAIAECRAREGKARATKPAAR